MNITETLTSLFILATLVEGIIEYFVSNPNKKQEWLKYVSAAIGVVVCIAYDVDLLATLGLVSPISFIGNILTGVVIGRGSNYLNDFISRVRKPQPTLVSVEKNETINATA